MKTWLLASLLAFSTSAVANPPATDSHAQAARELFRALEVEKMMDANLQQSLDMLAQQTGQPEKAKPRIEKFLKETIGFQASQGDLTNLYKKYFTEAELKELTRFYNTPIGKKMVRMQPVLFKEGSQIGQARMMAKQAELQKIIQEFQKKK